MGLVASCHQVGCCVCHLVFRLLHTIWHLRPEICQMPVAAASNHLVAQCTCMHELHACMKRRLERAGVAQMSFCYMCNMNE
jgi:hypothetical protein